MLVIKRFVCFILLSFAFSARGTISIGEAVPNGTYNAYASTGNHYKINIYRDLDNSSFENIYLSYGLQYIYFGENIFSVASFGLECNCWSKNCSLLKIQDYFLPKTKMIIKNKSVA